MALCVNVEEAKGALMDPARAFHKWVDRAEHDAVKASPVQLSTPPKFSFRNAVVTACFPLKTGPFSFPLEMRTEKFSGNFRKYQEKPGVKVSTTGFGFRPKAFLFFFFSRSSSCYSTRLRLPSKRVSVFSGKFVDEHFRPLKQRTASD